MNNEITPWNGNLLKDHPSVVQIDASSLQLLEHASHVLDGITQVNDGDKNTVDYADTAAQHLKRKLPMFTEWTAEIRNRLDKGCRFVVVDGLDFHKLPATSRDAFVLGTCASIGRPTPTDKIDRRIIWDVTPREYTSHSNTTFSEHNGEAEFHTDTQFFPEPERYFSLWTVQHARDGGGKSGMADAREIIRRMMKERLGRECMDILSKAHLPFRVPSVFTEDQSDECVEVLMAPVFADEPFMRYRKDTIRAGHSALEQDIDPDIQAALKYLESILSGTDLSHSHFLRSGQVIFGNNHELLHNRTAFNDQQRHLLRVRMAERVRI